MDLTQTSGIAPAGNTPTSEVYDANTNHDGRWTYDGAGNLLTANGNGLTYDAESRLASVADAGAVEAIAYDGSGNRVEKSVGGSVRTVYVYDAFGVLAAEYAPGAAVTGPCATCYVSMDAIGSTRLVTDQNGNVVARHDFLPFGEEITSTGGRTAQWGATADVEQKFTGQLRDTESGLDYFLARYYASSLNRFNSPDPLNAGADLMNPQSWNGYAYVLNNPLVNVDLSGMDSSNSQYCLSYTGGGNCQGNGAAADDPDLATDANPYRLNDWIDFYNAALQRLSGGSGSGGGGANFKTTVTGKADVGTVSTAALMTPPNNGTQNDDIVVTTKKKASQLLQCTADHFGLTVLGSGLAAAGANLLNTGGKFGGATPGTSVASKVAGGLLGDLKLPFRLPTLTGFPFIGNGLRVTFTESAARFAGRAVPVVGYALLAYDAYKIGACTVNGGE